MGQFLYFDKHSFLSFKSYENEEVPILNVGFYFFFIKVNVGFYLIYVIKGKYK